MERLSTVTALGSQSAADSAASSARGTGGREIPNSVQASPVSLPCAPPGETVFFPCSAWMGAARGEAERSLLGSRVNPREAQREAARLRQQAEAASSQLAQAQAELAAAKAASSSAEQASRGWQEELDGRLAALQAELSQMREEVAEARSGSAAAEAQAEVLRSQLARAEERAAALQREREAGRQREGSEAGRAAQLTAQVAALHDELAGAQEAAAAAATRARKCEAEARRAEEALDELRSAQQRHRRDSSARWGHSTCGRSFFIVGMGRLNPRPCPHQCCKPCPLLLAPAAWLMPRASCAACGRRRPSRLPSCGRPSRPRQSMRLSASS